MLMTKNSCILIDSILWRRNREVENWGTRFYPEIQPLQNHKHIAQVNKFSLKGKKTYFGESFGHLPKKKFFSDKFGFLGF